jgi:peptidase E
VTTRRILATSGGFVGGPVYGSARLGAMLLEALTLTRKTRPRVCLVYTATGDDAVRYAASYEAFGFAGCDVTELKLFTQPSANPEERLTSCDLVWVGGGSLANLPALWRLHGVDDAMRAAWERGVILGGVSAGSMCWHVGGTTDSFGPTLVPVTNALGLLPYGNSPHYDSEPQRRPMLHTLVSEGVLPLSFATDDAAGLWYEGTTPTRVVGDREADPDSGPAAYRVEVVNGDVVETRLRAGTSAV